MSPIRIQFGISHTVVLKIVDYHIDKEKCIYLQTHPLTHGFSTGVSNHEISQKMVFKAPKVGSHGSAKVHCSAFSNSNWKLHIIFWLPVMFKVSSCDYIAMQCQIFLSFFFLKKWSHCSITYYTTPLTR